jgi:nicotinamide-nucleotide amidase
MNAEIIAIGSELLLGQIANTNAQYLSKELAQIGVNVFFHQVVGDNEDRLKETVEIASSRSDIIIFTGGLGPTKDDLTKESIAAFLNKQLVLDEEALERIRSYFEKVNSEMTENNKKQAIVIEGAEVFPNDFGMAPGMGIVHKKALFLLFPGPPKELYPMFSNYAIPYLKKHIGDEEVIVSQELRFFGIGEAKLETELTDLINEQTNPTIAPLAGDGEVMIRLTAKHHDRDKAQLLIANVEKKIEAIVGEYLYGYNDTSLAKETFKILDSKKLTIASAESLTGGLFAKDFTDIAGASQIFLGGVVCYSNDVKQQILNIPQQILLQHGAVSEQCAKLMAEQVRSICNTNLGISFTGVAGPSSVEGKPVGTVFIGISMEGRPTKVFSMKLAGSRSAIRLRAIKFGYHYIMKYLLA